MREFLIEKTIFFLEKKGFVVSTYLHLNNCFDIAAKKREQIFLLKILSNIDALREEQAAELKRIGDVFNASVFVVGEKSKSFLLNQGTVYERHGINCMNFETFKNLVENDLPEIKYFKGKKIVELDTQRLKQKRKELGLTLEEIAQKINLTAESVRRFETKGSATLETAHKLGHFFGDNFVRKIDLLKTEQQNAPIQPKHVDEAFHKIQKLGLKLEFFSHAPFKAYSHPLETIYFSQSKHAPELKKKAQELAKTKRIVGGIPLIIAKDYEKEQISDIPVIKEGELFSMSKKKNLLDLAKEREKHAKRKQV